jgi:hypothetical protein
MAERIRPRRGGRANVKKAIMELNKYQRKRAALLHSVVYEPGDALFKEFPKQTTIGDLNLIIER